MITVLHVGRSVDLVERLLSASVDPAISVCNAPTVDSAVGRAGEWRPDCWLFDREALPTDPQTSRRIASATFGSPLLICGDGPIPSSLAEDHEVRRVTPDGLVDAVLEAVEGREDRPGPPPSSVLLSLLDRSADRVARLDRHGRYLSVDDRMAALLGVSASQVVETTLSEHAPGADPDTLRTWGGRAIDTGTIQRYENDVHRYLFVPNDDEFRLIVQERIDGATNSEPEPVSDFVGTVLNRLTDIFFVFDLQGRFLHWNDRLTETTGYTDEEVASMNPMSFFVEEDHDRVAAAVSEVVATGEATDVVRIRTRDGRLLPYEFTGSLVPDGDGEPRYVCGIARGVSRREHAERALRERQQALSNLIRNLPGVVLRYRTESGYPVEFMGRGCVDIAGYTMEQFEHGEVSWIEDVVHPADHDRVRTCVRDAVEAAEQYQIRYRIRTDDDALRWVWEQGAVVEGSDGSIDYVDSYVSEITDIVWLQRELRRERAFTESALDAQPDLFYVFTPQGRILRWNDRFADVTGYTDEEIASMHPTEFLEPDDAERVIDAMTRVVSEERTLSVEATLVTKDDDRIPYEFVGSVMEDVNEPIGEPDARTDATDLYICGTGRDITQRVEAEAELEAAIADLERSNDELERFAYVASHDLKEPLRMIHSYLDLIRRRYENQLDEDADEFIEYAIDGADRMRQMIDDLLTYSRIGTSDAEFDRVDCQDVLDRALDNLRLAIDETDAAITVDPLPTVTADDQQLVQLFQNLLSNAIAYAGEAEPRIHVSASETDDGWCFSISDEGIGIAEEQIEEVFEIFSSGSNGTNSTGIGLAICEKIVTRHGGDIWVESRPGVGSTFRFTVPHDGQPAPDRSSRRLDA
ncbi:PAS domain-containing sensor histidine kinase [Halalkalicoccus ordinarius]|uniref:PAS domain-containing sensor histidine kinase n=1 Tax=Halalkalicoccus ordinarius TaxID=3116651 RepID=UPI00300F41EB